jgi:hypothetical protein
MSEPPWSTDELTLAWSVEMLNTSNPFSDMAMETIRN